MAGAEGLEPSTKVLETHVLPLHHAPTFAPRTIKIILRGVCFVNMECEICGHVAGCVDRRHWCIVRLNDATFDSAFRIPDKHDYADEGALGGGRLSFGQFVRPAHTALFCEFPCEILLHALKYDRTCRDADKDKGSWRGDNRDGLFRLLPWRFMGLGFYCFLLTSNESDGGITCISHISDSAAF